MGVPAASTQTQALSALLFLYRDVCPNCKGSRAIGLIAGELAIFVVFAEPIGFGIEA